MTLNFDPSNPTVIPPVTGNMTFTDCVIKVCGTTFTLSGGTSNTITIAQNGNAIIVTFTANNQVISGPISGAQNFSNSLTAVATKTEIQSLTIQDSSPAQPLTALGMTFNANILSAEADGC